MVTFSVYGGVTLLIQAGGGNLCSSSVVIFVSCWWYLFVLFGQKPSHNKQVIFVFVFVTTSN
jgi:hypothetical protein